MCRQLLLRKSVTTFQLSDVLNANMVTVKFKSHLVKLFVKMFGILPRNRK